MCSIGLVRMGPLYIFRPKELGSTMFYQIKHRYYISKSGVRPFVGKCAMRLCAPVSVMVAGKRTTSINPSYSPPNWDQKCLSGGQYCWKISQRNHRRYNKAHPLVSPWLLVDGRCQKYKILDKIIGAISP